MEDRIYVVSHLRDWNRRELQAAFGPAAISLAHEWLHQFPQIQYTMGIGDRPVVIMGGVPLAPDHWAVYFLGTDQMEDIAWRCIRPVRRVLAREAAARQVTRITARALAGNPKSPRWFEALGAARQPGLDVGFEVYAWTFAHVLPQSLNSGV